MIETFLVSNDWMAENIPSMSTFPAIQWQAIPLGCAWNKSSESPKSTKLSKECLSP